MVLTTCVCVLRFVSVSAQMFLVLKHTQILFLATFEERGKFLINFVFENA